MTSYLGILFYLIIFNLFFSLIRYFGKFQNFNVALYSLVLAIITFIIGYYNSKNFKVTHIKIPVENIKKEMKIAHLSDIHLGIFRDKEYLRRIINKVNEEKCDLVIINGDFIDNDVELKDENIKLLKEFKARVLYTDGNHEHYINHGKLIESLNQNSIEIMNNRVINIDDIQIVGFSYMNADDETVDMHRIVGGNIKDTIKEIEIDKDKFSIFVHHSPVGVKYVKEKGFDLMLSGHTHGAQFYPLSFFTKYFYPYFKGLYKIDDFMIYVSQGLGTFVTNIRLGSFNEINIINLYKE
jgi:predicted MPP superfamily phosphohydrolase